MGQSRDQQQPPIAEHVAKLEQRIQELEWRLDKYMEEQDERDRSAEYYE